MPLQTVMGAARAAWRSRGAVLCVRRCGRGRLDVGLKPFPGPSTVEAYEFGAVIVEDVRRDHALLALPCQHHDHEATCTHVFDVTHQVLVLLVRCRASDQQPLELREYAMFRACWIEPANIRFAMKHIDVLPIEASLKQFVDRGVRVVLVGDGADDTIDRVRDEVRALGRARFHNSPANITALIIPPEIPSGFAQRSS
jgi:hypothetical protein